MSYSVRINDMRQQKEFTECGRSAVLGRPAGWLLALLLAAGGCSAAPGSNRAMLDSVDEEKVIAAAEKDSFPSAHSPD